MLALIAGTGALPGILVGRLGGDVVLAELAGNPAELPRPADLPFRLETFGTLLAALKARGVTRVCLAGGIRRPEIDPGAIDAATLPLVPKLSAALGQGDAGALRIVMEIIEDAGLAVVGAHELAPDLLPPAGVLAGVPGPDLERDARAGAAHLADMGRRDSGQACVLCGGVLVDEEGPDGTDALLARGGARGGTLFKGPKPDQDRRVDLPVIGPGTVRAAAEAGLAAIVIEAGGVMVLDQPRVVALCGDLGLTLWVRQP